MSLAGARGPGGAQVDLHVGHRPLQEGAAHLGEECRRRGTSRPAPTGRAAARVEAVGGRVCGGFMGPPSLDAVEPPSLGGGAAVEPALSEVSARRPMLPQRGQGAVEIGRQRRLGLDGPAEARVR